MDGQLLPICQAVPSRTSLYLVGQQKVPDLSQILLGEDKAHISFNVGQKPVDSQRHLDNTVVPHLEQYVIVLTCLRPCVPGCP